jgi:tetratricopeptide (TPR) repeat protein
LTLALCAATASAQNEGIVQQYRKALEMNPNDMDARYLLGVSLLREKSYKEALSHLIKVYPSRAGEAEINYNIGLAYAGAGELQKAFEHYRKVDEINAIEARDRFHLDMAFYNIGMSYQRDGKLDEALRAYQEAIQIDPEKASAYCAKGEVLYQKKDYNGALESLKRCREKDPERKGINRYISSIHQARGIDYLNRKNYTEARVELDRAIGFDPENESAYYYKGYTDYLDGDYRKALASIERIKGTKREDMKKALASMLHNIGGAMQKDEDWEGAITAFRQAVAINGADPDLHFYLGYSYMKAKEFDPAIAAFKEALRLDPRHQRAAVNLAIASEVSLKSHLELGAAYLRKGLFNEALKEFNIAISIDPGNRNGVEGKESAEKGVEKLEREAAEKRQREITAKLLEGSKFIADGKYPEAKKSFDAVLSLDPENTRAKEGAKKVGELLRQERERHAAAGEKAFAEGRYHNAVVEYRLVLGYDPDDRDSSIRLEESLKRLSEQVSPILKEARGHENAGRFTDALSAYDKALQIQPDNKGALEGKSRVSEGLEKAFGEALSKGREYAKAGELMKAAESYGRALELKPDNAIALDEFRNISGKLRNVIGVRMADAASALKAGRYTEAISNYRAVLMIDKENKEAASGLQNAVMLRDEAVGRKMAAGLKAFKEGNYHLAAGAFGEVLQIDGNNTEAQRLQRDARAKMEETVAPWIKAGVEAYKKGDADAAAVSFKKVLNVDPGNREAKEYLGKIDVLKTKASVEKEVERHYLKGIELYTDGKYRDAIESWKKVLELDPKHEKALLNIEKAKRKMEGVMDTK